MALSKEDALGAYRRMATIREFEERLHVEVTTGEIAGFCHLYSGQEAVAVGVCDNLDETDYIASTHRGHGHCIAKGCDVDGMMKEIFGRRDGLCGGKGGSMHIADMSKGMLGANAIVGGGPPIAVGAAIATKLDGKGRVTASFTGDGGSNQGTVFEAMNLAVVLQLPTIFVFENNGYGEHTGADYSVGSKDIRTRSEGFGMPSVEVDGSDYFAVREAMAAAVERARNGEGPSAVVARTTRFFGHFEGDPQRYRAPDEVKQHRETLDCLKRFRAVAADYDITGEELDAIDAEVRDRIDQSVAAARSAPAPNAEDVLTDVYVSY